VTTQDTIRTWLHDGRGRGATHVIVGCETFDWTDYPVYVLSDMDIHEAVAKYNGVNMQKIMEVYKLSDDLEEQLTERRVWRI
jgi:hypothetical protein